EGCIVRAIGSGSGKIDMTADGEDIELFVSNLALVTGRKVGALSFILSPEGSGDTTITPVITPVSRGGGLSGYGDTTVSGVISSLNDPGAGAVMMSLWATDPSAFVRPTNDLPKLDPAAAAGAQGVGQSLFPTTP